MHSPGLEIHGSTYPVISAGWPLGTSITVAIAGLEDTSEFAQMVSGKPFRRVQVVSW